MATRRLSWVRGDTHVFNVVFKNAAGAAYCIKNWAVHFTMKTNWSLPDSAASLQKIVTSFPDTTAGTCGSAQISIAHGDTATLDPQEYDFDIVATTNLGEHYTVYRGKVDLQYDVTGTAGTAGVAP